MSTAFPGPGSALGTICQTVGRCDGHMREWYSNGDDVINTSYKQTLFDSAVILP